MPEADFYFKTSPRIPFHFHEPPKEKDEWVVPK
jgi:hypothetical protein